VRKVLRSAAPSQLDWFHIGMRLERLKKAVRLPVTYAEYLSSPDASKPREKRLSLIRDALWRGRAHEAEAQFDLLQRDVDSWRRQHPEGDQAASLDGSRRIGHESPRQPPNERETADALES
jgi:hypothetical protein